MPNKKKKTKLYEKATRTNCWFCGSEMIWGGDHNSEDYGYPEGGVVANMSCSNDKCGATALFVSKVEE